MLERHDSDGDGPTRWPALVAVAMLVVSVAGLATAQRTPDADFEVAFDGPAHGASGSYIIELEADGEGEARFADGDLTRYRADTGELEIEAETADGDDVGEVELVVDDLSVRDGEWALRAEAEDGDARLEMSGLAIPADEADDETSDEALLDLTVSEVSLEDAPFTLEGVDAIGQLEIG